MIENINNGLGNNESVARTPSFRRLPQSRFPRIHRVLRALYYFLFNYWKPKTGNIIGLLDEFCSADARSLISFVQIGANNGDDEFTNLRKRHGWLGVMVEPQQEVFAELVRLNSCDGLYFEQVAISDHECELPMYKISFSEADWAHTLASFDRQIIKRSIDDGWIARCAAAEGIVPPKSTGDWVTTETVCCITLQKLLDKYQLTNLDLLILDTEGHDYEIIKQMETLQHKPRALVFEHKFFSARDLRACVKTLRAWGYKLNADDSNTIGIAKRVSN